MRRSALLVACRIKRRSLGTASRSFQVRRRLLANAGHLLTFHLRMSRLGIDSLVAAAVGCSTFVAWNGSARSMTPTFHRLRTKLTACRSPIPAHGQCSNGAAKTHRTDPIGIAGKFLLICGLRHKSRITPHKRASLRKTRPVGGGWQHRSREIAVPSTARITSVPYRRCARQRLLGEGGVGPVLATIIRRKPRRIYGSR